MNIETLTAAGAQVTDRSDVPVSPHLMAALRHHAGTNAAGLAVGFDGPDEPYTRLSWQDLFEAALKFAAFIKAAGADPGERIVILTPFVSHQIMGFLGSVAAGCVPTIVSYPSSKQSPDAFLTMLKPILENCRPRLLLSELGFADVLRGSGFASIVKTFPSPPDLPAPLAAPQMATDAPLFLQFSSGTTGARKAVSISAAMFAAQSDAYAAALGLGAQDVVVNWLPLYHDMGLVAAFLIPIHRGMTAVHQSPFEWLTRPERMFELVEAHRATVLWLPNFAYELLVDRVHRDAAGDLGSLRAIVNCSEPVRAETQARFQQAFAPRGLRDGAMLTCYAMAETTFAVTQSSPGAPPMIDRICRSGLHRDAVARPVGPDNDTTDVHLSLSSGRALPGTQIRIAGTAEDRQLGEIEVRSDALFDGYLYHPTPRQDFGPDGWFRTGDIGYTVGDQLFVTGRKKDVIIRRGHNLFSADIESELADVEGCKPGRIVVFGVDDDQSGTQRLVIMVERAGDPTDDRRLAAALRERLLNRLNETVDDVVVCGHDTLLKSTSGKLSREANKTTYLGQRAAAGQVARQSDPQASPDASIESTLEAIWRQILNVPRIDADTRLFSELGLDSIGSMRGIGEILKVFGRKIDPSQILTLDTIERQARVIRSGQDHGGADGVVLCLQKGDARPPLFLVHPAAGRGWPYSTLLPYLPAAQTVYALQSPELFEAGALLTVEAMASRYLDEIQRLMPDGPLLIAGWSFGGAIAHTIACLAQRRHRAVATLVLFDTDPPRSWTQRIIFRARQHFSRKIAVRAASRVVDRMAGIRPSSCSRYLQGLDPARVKARDLAALERYSVGANPMPRRVSDPVAIATRIFAAIEASCRIDEFRPFLIPTHDTAQKLLNSRILVKNRSLAVLFKPIGRFTGDVHIIAAEKPDRLRGWHPHVQGRVVVHDFPIDGTASLTPHLNMMAAGNVAKFGPLLGDLITKFPATSK